MKTPLPCAADPGDILCLDDAKALGLDPAVWPLDNDGDTMSNNQQTTNKISRAAFSEAFLRRCIHRKN